MSKDRKAFGASQPGANDSQRSIDRDGASALARLHALAAVLTEVSDSEGAATAVLEAALGLLGEETGFVRLLDPRSGDREVEVRRGPVNDETLPCVPLVGSTGTRIGAFGARGLDRELPAFERQALELSLQQAVLAIERIRASARAHESELRYTALFESIDEAFAVVEVLLDDAGAPHDYRVLETNPVYLRHTALENVVGRTARELVPGLEPFWVETFGRVARTGEPERFTHSVAALDRWFDCYAFRFGDPVQRQVAVFFSDVSERESAERLDRFFAALDDATWSLAEPEKISATIVRLLGEHLGADRVVYTEVDDDQEGVAIVGEWPSDPPSLRGRYRFGDFGVPLREALKQGRAYVVDDFGDGGELDADVRERFAARDLRAMVQVPLLKEGRLRSSIAVFQRTARRWREDDLELVRSAANRCWEAIERARVASRLRDSEEQFRTLSNLLPQFIWIARPDGHIYWFNEYAHAFFGPDAPIEGLGWMRYHDPVLLPEIERGYAEALAAGTTYSCTTRFRNAAGEYRWFLARMIPQRDEDGRALRFLGYNIDVTDLYETQARLVQADRRKDEFLATLAHELRNPLAPLYNLLEILKLKPGQAITNELREVMHRQVHHLGRLVDDLLDASRITRGVVELQRERVLLGEVLGSAVETSRPQIEARGHRLRVEAPDEPLGLFADAVRLTQVFANLLNNAAKYTDENGQIGVRVARDGDDAVVRVRDDGIGIARENLVRVFDLFTQIDRHSGRAQGGLGIGLSLSRGLVEMHGGTLTVTSDGIGRGSEFCVRLPLDREGSPSASPALDADTRRPQSSVRVLVVDDNVDAAESLGALLESLGADAAVVYDGAAALERLSGERFAAAFVDLGMPQLDGLEVARRIRRDLRLGGLVLVAVTGWGQEQDRARSREAGFDHHLVKPAEVESLRGVLRELGAAGRAKP